MSISLPFRCSVCGRVERIRVEELRGIPTCHEQPMEFAGDPNLQSAVDAIMNGVSDLVVAALRADNQADE